MTPLATYYLSIATLLFPQDTTNAAELVSTVANTLESHVTASSNAQIGGPVFINAAGVATLLNRSLGSAMDGEAVRARVAGARSFEHARGVSGPDPDRVKCERDSGDTVCRVDDNGIVLWFETARRTNGSVEIVLVSTINEREEDRRIRAKWSRLRITLRRVTSGWQVESVEELEKGLVRGVPIG